MRFRQRLLALFLGDCVLLYAALSFALWARQAGDVDPDFLLGHLLPFASIFPIWAGVFYAVGLYDFHRMRDLVTLIRDSLLAMILNILAGMGIFYLFYHHIGLAPKTNLLLTAVFGHSALLGWRHLWVRVLSINILTQRIAFWGESPLIRAMSQDIKANPQAGFRVAGPVFIPEPASRRGQGGFWLPAIEKGALKRSVDLLVIDSDQVEADSSLAERVFSLALKEDIPIMTHLDFYERAYHRVPPHYAARPAWLLGHVLPRHRQAYLWSKRACDCLIAAVGLAATAPILILIAFLSKVFEGGSPFYTQSRVGYLGKEFRIWKFRTMAEGSDKEGPRWSSPAPGSQVTPFGRFLRRFRLDELPQLWNVLRGDMSLVGPRPEWVAEVRVIEKSVPHYHLRHLVKPGITGWAQVNFRATSSCEESLEKLHYDLFYVKNISLALDVGILLKTSRRVFMPDEGLLPGLSTIPQAPPEALDHKVRAATIALETAAVQPPAQPSVPEPVAVSG